MTDCIKPRSLQKNISSTFVPKILAKESEDSLIEYNSIKLQKLKRTLELVKRYQDDLMVPFFSYQVVNGIKWFNRRKQVAMYRGGDWALCRVSKSSIVRVLVSAAM